MDYREEYDAEIDLKDMLFYILRRWRSILLAGLVFCALLGVYKAVRNARLSPEDLVPKKIKDYEFELAQYDLDKDSYERELQNYSELLERQQLYMEKSVLMQTDPYYKPIATADVFVKLDNTEWDGLPSNLGLDPTDSIIKTYTSDFSSTLDWGPIEELTGNEKIYLEELLNVSVDYSSNTITVRVVYSDGQTAQEILDIVLEQVLDRQQDINAEVGHHTLTISNRSLAYAIDRSLAESQRNNMSVIAGYEQSILSQRMKQEELEEPKKPFVIGFAKYPLAGFFLGAFLMAAFYGADYLLSGKLHGERNLQDKYGYVLLGTFPKPRRTGFLSAIDHYLDKVAGAPSISEEDTYRRIALNLVNLTGENKHILLTGTVAFTELHTLTDMLSRHLNGITLTAAANMNLHADTLKALSECDAVLFVEREGESCVSAIRKEHETTVALGRPVIGYVLL